MGNHGGVCLLLIFIHSFLIILSGPRIIISCPILLRLINLSTAHSVVSKCISSNHSLACTNTQVAVLLDPLDTLDTRGFSGGYRSFFSDEFSVLVHH